MKINSHPIPHCQVLELTNILQNSFEGLNKNDSYFLQIYIISKNWSEKIYLILIFKVCLTNI